MVRDQHPKHVTWKSSVPGVVSPSGDEPEVSISPKIAAWPADETGFDPQAAAAVNSDMDAVLTEVEQIAKSCPAIDMNGDDSAQRVSSALILQDGSRTAKWRYRAKRLVESEKFDAAMAFVIVSNSLCVGLETSADLEGYDIVVYEAFENVFLIIYMVELALRFFVYGIACLKNPWVAFDLILVCMGVLSNYIVGPIIHNLNDDGGALESSMSEFMVLRMLRLFRFARAVRLLVRFKTLWMLIRGLIGSVETISYTFLVILLILYVGSCIAMEMITKKMRYSDDEKIRAIVQEYFRNIPVGMLTLVQFVTVDSIASIYHPLIIADSHLLPFFVIFILVVSIALMNLVTAIIVEGAIQQGKEAHDRYKQQRLLQLRPALRALYHELDADGDANVTLGEIRKAPESVKKVIEDFIPSDSLETLFEMIDIDESGEVCIDELLDGIAMFHSETPAETIRILKQLSASQRDLKELKSTVADLKTSVDQILQHLAAAATRDRPDRTQLQR